MTEEDKDKIRAKVLASNAQMVEGLAPYYLGRFCPWFGGECKGPECTAFLLTGEGSKITGGNCAIPLIASQAAPIADGLVQLAMSNRSVESLPRVIPTGPIIR